jgi:tetratricopeptide (TPR) repeat protein
VNAIRINIMIAAVLCIAAAAARADSPRTLVDRGNRSYEKNDFDAAIEYYERASVRDPESPIVAFNTGNAFYRREEYAAAREHFEGAALKADELSLEARSWYNAGNCAFREGERQVDDDPEKALEFFQESVQLYTTSLDKDPGLMDAAHNIEVTRIIIKDLLDKIKQQQEQMQQQQERFQAVVDSLRALIARQEEAAADSEELESSDRRGTDEWNAGVDDVEDRQGMIAGGTGAVRDTLRSFFPDTIPQQVAEALSHIDSSLVHQDDALNDLAGRRPGDASVDQSFSLDQLRKALEALAEDQQGNEGQDQQRQGGEQPQPREEEPTEEEQKQQQEQQASKTARGILEEEKENKEKRQKAAQGYRAVDRDW